MILLVMVINILLCISTLAWGYHDAGMSSMARWFLLLGIPWLYASWRQINWVSSIGLMIAVLASGIGLLFGVIPGWMLASCLFGLIAWDLTAFRARLSLAYFEDDLSGMERRHLLRISLLSLAALGLATIAMVANLRISFEWMLLVAIVTALGITQIIRWFRNSS